MSEEKSEVKIKDLRILLQKYNSDLGIYINSVDRYKLGRVLTIIDASIADPEQRKAIKDLINGDWWGTRLNKESTEMDNPHSDLRGLCEAVGFDLYEEQTYDVPSNSDMREYTKKRYEDALKTSK